MYLKFNFSTRARRNPIPWGLCESEMRTAYYCTTRFNSYLWIDSAVCKCHDGALCAHHNAFDNVVLCEHLWPVQYHHDLKSIHREQEERNPHASSVYTINSLLQVCAFTFKCEGNHYCNGSCRRWIFEREFALRYVLNWP